MDDSKKKQNGSKKRVWVLLAVSLIFLAAYAAIYLNQTAGGSFNTTTSLRPAICHGNITAFGYNDLQDKLEIRYSFGNMGFSTIETDGYRTITGDRLADDDKVNSTESNDTFHGDFFVNGKIIKEDGYIDRMYGYLYYHEEGYYPGAKLGYATFSYRVNDTIYTESRPSLIEYTEDIITIIVIVVVAIIVFILMLSGGCG